MVVGNLLHCKFILFSPFPSCILWKEVNRWGVEFCSISLRQSSCTHYMELFSQEDVSTPHFYRWWIFILWVTIQHYLILFILLLKLFQFGHWGLSQVTPISLWHTLSTVFLLCFMRTCWLLSDNTNAPGSPYRFHALVLESALSLRICWFPLLGNSIRTKIWENRYFPKCSWKPA